MSTPLAIGIVVGSVVLYFIVKTLLAKYDASIKSTYGYEAFSFLKLLVAAVFPLGIIGILNGSPLAGALTAVASLALLVFINYRGLTKSCPLNVKTLILVTLMQLLQISVIAIALFMMIIKKLMDHGQAIAFGGSPTEQSGRNKFYREKMNYYGDDESLEKAAQSLGVDREYDAKVAAEKSAAIDEASKN